MQHYIKIKSEDFPGNIILIVCEYHEACKSGYDANYPFGGYGGPEDAAEVDIKELYLCIDGAGLAQVPITDKINELYEPIALQYIEGYI